ncbi:hypothetical protein L21SP5_00187 [Salinivirga cyanobacteriivorans]|uniref:Uncharacterized protein n=1 Tax=Salinivirga cyanobacteriivorans TaxID=1307839 RepID=A0A0S2HUY4_9BACT|nr:hypothetical protein [Salinivirga cyanobacteriivorans]ALO13867.1 hypothetical protein L21SP5_00187 [Salinivirga cyanobacteriivorans]
MKSTINIFYIIINILFVFLYTGIIKVINACQFYSKEHFFSIYDIVFIVFIPFIGLIYSRIQKIKKWKLLYNSVIPMVLILGSIFLRQKIKESIVEQKSDTIRKAYVMSNRVGKLTNTLIVTFKQDSLKNIWTITLNDDTNGLEKGDSILIMYQRDCKGLHDIFKLFPTKEEFIKYSPTSPRL